MATHIYKAATAKVKTGGVSVAAVWAAPGGGRLTNPASAQDQGLGATEPLFYSFVDPAALTAGQGTFELLPGQQASFPLGLETPVWVNATTTGHKFSAVFFAASVQYPPTVISSTFPPPSPTTQTRVIKSYLYKEYDDDDDLQAFTASYNALAQQYIDTINALNLPIYTKQSGALLDWVAQGLYGIARPYLSSGLIRRVGAYNTFAFNTISYNTSKAVSNVQVAITSDDVFKRIITWHFYKGDGKVFNVRWLKRRIMRFINGVNGTAPDVDDTSQVSVSFGVGNQIDITLITQIVTRVKKSSYNSFSFNTVSFNGGTYSVRAVPPLDSTYLVEGIKTGVLELPFQFTYTVTVG